MSNNHEAIITVELIAAERSRNMALHETSDRVALRFCDGALSFVSESSGFAVRLIVAEDAIIYIRSWTVSVEDTPQALRLAMRAVCPDDNSLKLWLRSQRIGRLDDTEWNGYKMRPVSAECAQMHALREIIGVQPRDEGSTMCERFVDWLAARNIQYKFTERVVYEY